MKPLRIFASGLLHQQLGQPLGGGMLIADIGPGAQSIEVAPLGQRSGQPPGIHTPSATSTNSASNGHCETRVCETISGMAGGWFLGQIDGRFRTTVGRRPAAAHLRASENTR